MSWRRPNLGLIAGGLGASAFLVGLTRAGDQPFWFDEAFTGGAAQQSFSQLCRFLWREAGMGPYYLALWVWAQFGQSESWLRTFSVLGGAATLAITYLFAARFVDRTVAALTVLGLGCNSFFLYNLTELRAYSWVMFAAVSTTWAFLRLRARPSTSRALAYGAAAGLSLGMLVFSGGLLLAHLLFTGPLWRTRPGRRALLVAGLVAAALFAPFVHALATSNQIAWIPRTTWAWVDVQTGGAFGGTKWRLFDGAGCALLAVMLVRRRRRGTPHVVLEVCTIGMLSMIVTLLLVSFAEPVFIARYLAGALPFAVLIAMAGYLFAAKAVLARVPSPAFARSIVPLALAIACVIGFKGSLFDDLPKPEDIRQPSRALSRDVAPGDVVVFDGRREALAIGYYFAAPPGVEVIGWEGVSRTDACTLWFVGRGSAADLEQRVRAVLPDAQLDAAQYSVDGIVEAHRCP